MLKCSDCGTQVEVSATACWNCGAAFERDDAGQKIVIAEESSAASLQARSFSRPNGGALLVTGSLMIGLSVLLFVLGGAAATKSAGSMIGGGLMVYVSGTVFQIGLCLALAGFIVRAIWFLPGDETKLG